MKAKEEIWRTEELVFVKLFPPQRVATEVLNLVLEKKMMFLHNMELHLATIAVKMIA
jgi:hypothetical protein